MFRLRKQQIGSWKGSKMDPSKSQVDFLAELYSLYLSTYLYDLPSSSFPKSSQKDISTLRDRLFSEGTSFLTKTLPKLGKALEQALETTRFFCPREFKRSHKNKFVPAFMQEHFNRVVGEDGFVLEQANITALRHILFVCLHAYKLELPYSEKEENNVINAFFSTEQELERSEETGSFQYSIIDPLGSISDCAAQIFSGFDPDDILPRHGPGAVAGGEKGDEKWEKPTFYPSLDACYPYEKFFILGGRSEVHDRFGEFWNIEERPYGVSKVVLVPKDSRGPRLISCEPREYMWLQQGLGRKLATWLEGGNPFSRGQINFTDQGTNGRIALESSKTREFATLDLKDASDRVSRMLVQWVFRRLPRLRTRLLSLRSHATILPTRFRRDICKSESAGISADSTPSSEYFEGGVREVTIRKFAPMGSAICFPIEATVFYCILVGSLHDLGIPLSRARRMVYVYGDDIIVPSRYASFCMDRLELFGLKVNRSKSFHEGFFRESCGENAYKGESVTPLRLRKPFTGRRGDGAAFASYVSLANKLAERGYVSASDYLWDEIESTYGKIPYGTKFSSFPCRIIPDANEAEKLNHFQKRTRWNQHLQRFEFKVLCLESPEHKTSLDGWPRALRNLTSGHGERPDSFVLPRETLIKRRWKAVY